MDCVLVGRPALKSVGVDIFAQVEKLALDQQVAWINTPQKQESEESREQH